LSLFPDNLLATAPRRPWLQELSSVLRSGYQKPTGVPRGGCGAPGYGLFPIALPVRFAGNY